MFPLKDEKTKCPECNGKGKIPYNYSYGSAVCPTCKGKKFITIKDFWDYFNAIV